MAMVRGNSIYDLGFTIGENLTEGNGGNGDRMRILNRERREIHERAMPILN